MKFKVGDKVIVKRITIPDDSYERFIGLCGTIKIVHQDNDSWDDDSPYGVDLILPDKRISRKSFNHAELELLRIRKKIYKTKEEFNREWV